MSHLLRVDSIYFFSFSERLLHEHRASGARLPLKGTRFLAYQVFSSSNGWKTTSVTGCGRWLLVSSTSCRLPRSQTCPTPSKQGSNNPYLSSNKDSNTPILQYIARRVQFSRLRPGKLARMVRLVCLNSAPPPCMTRIALSIIYHRQPLFFPFSRFTVSLPRRILFPRARCPRIGGQVKVSCWSIDIPATCGTRAATLPSYTGSGSSVLSQWVGETWQHAA